MAKRRSAPPPVAVPGAGPWPGIVFAVVLTFYCVTAVWLAFAMPTIADGPTYAKYTPPDEGSHVGYLAELLQLHALPRFTSGAGNYEAHQPPLYYVTALPAYLLARAAGGQGGFGSPSLKLLRLWSVLWGAGALLLAYLLGRRLFPHSWPLQVALPAVLAALPSRTFICASVSNDAASEFFSTGALLLMAIGLREGFTLRRVVWLGGVIGLGLLTKTTCLALIPCALLALLLGARQEGKIDWRRVLGWAGIIGGIVVLLWGWWAVRNVMLYGDPLAARAFHEIFRRDRATPAYFLDNPKLHFTPLLYAELVASQTYLSLLGVYGQVACFMPKLYYALGKIVSVLALVGLMAGPIRRRLEPANPPIGPVAVWGVLLLLLAAVLADFAVFNMGFFQAQARYLFPANAVIAALAVVGWSGLWRDRWQLVPVWLAIGLLVVMTGWSLAAMQALQFLPFGSQ